MGRFAPMISGLFGVLGMPLCARDGCGVPALVRFQFSDEDGPVWIDLCPLCVTEIRRCLEEVAELREARRIIEGE